MIGLLKYGSGLPFNRLEGLQGDLGVPLPASTQWDIVEAVAANLAPAFDELIRQAAQGEVLHNDDTTVKILELMGERGRQEALADAEADDADERRGLYTSGVVALRDGHRVALFFSGRRHAGENLARGAQAPRRGVAAADPDVRCAVAQPAGRAADDPGELPGPCPAAVRRCLRSLPRAVPPPARIAGRGLSQRRRGAGASAVARGPSAVPSGSERADDASSCTIGWTRQLGEKRTEPNSALGGAIGYMLKHWEKLTLFLRQAGAPLDNNLCERALKKAILHRKNALFYKTQNGARVGDLFMSLIYTCQLNQANPFDYLTELQRHAEALAAQPRALDAVELPRRAGLSVDDSGRAVRYPFTIRW